MSSPKRYISQDINVGIRSYGGYQDPVKKYYWAGDSDKQEIPRNGYFYDLHTGTTVKLPARDPDGTETRES